LDVEEEINKEPRPAAANDNPPLGNTDVDEDLISEDVSRSESEHTIESDNSESEIEDFNLSDDDFRTLGAI